MLAFNQRSVKQAGGVWRGQNRQLGRAVDDGTPGDGRLRHAVDGAGGPLSARGGRSPRVMSSGAWQGLVGV